MGALTGVKTAGPPSRPDRPLQGSNAVEGQGPTGAPGSRLVSGRLIVIVAFLATMAAVGFALATRGELVRNLRPPAPAPKLYGNAVWAPGKGPVGHLGGLHDQAGGIVRLEHLRGRVVILTFMDSKCTTLCPVEAAELASMRKFLPPKLPVQLIVVSTDPTGDTPASVRAFAARFGWPRSWHWEWLMGSRAQLGRVWASYGIGVQSVVAHTSAVFVLDPQGHARVAMGVPFPRQILASDVKQLA